MTIFFLLFSLADAAPKLPSAPAKPSVSAKALIGTVTKGDLVQRVTVTGSIVPKRRTVFIAPYAGYVHKLYVKTGDTVAAGAPIVSVSQSLLSSPGEIYPIRAPFAGTVVQVIKQEGEYVQTGTGAENTILRVDDLAAFFVESFVPELDLPKISLGQEVVVKASSLVGKTFKGVIREIALASKDSKEWGRSVEFPIKIEILEKDAGIRSGMSAMVDVISGKRNQVLMLGLEYLEKSGEKTVVTLEDGSQRAIKIGLQNEEAAEVTEGLKEGDRVKPVDFYNWKPQS